MISIRTLCTALVVFCISTTMVSQVSVLGNAGAIGNYLGWDNTNSAPQGMPPAVMNADTD